MIKFTRKLFKVEDVTKALEDLKEKSYSLSMDDEYIYINKVTSDEATLTRHVILRSVISIAKKREAIVAECLRANIRNVMNDSSKQ